jgi:enterobactin synthetase component D / holo-[acyl-carrier protein] synthase
VTDRHAIPGTDGVHNPRVLPESISQFSLLLTGGGSAADFPVALPPELMDAQPLRRLHYAAGRYCASRAIEALDPPARSGIVDRGVAGEPIWPAGIVGSITHSGAFVSAAVAHGKDAAGIGIDTQELLTSERMVHVMPTILSASEVQRATESALGPSLWTTLAFCAKEALFKCLYPVVGMRFYYAAAEVTSIDTGDRTFTIALTETLRPGFEAGTGYDGRFELSHGHAHAGLWRPPAGADAV